MDRTASSSAEVQRTKADKRVNLSDDYAAMDRKIRKVRNNEGHGRQEDMAAGLNPLFGKIIHDNLRKIHNPG